MNNQLVTQVIEHWRDTIIGQGDTEDQQYNQVDEAFNNMMAPYLQDMSEERLKLALERDVPYIHIHLMATKLAMAFLHDLSDASSNDPMKHLNVQLKCGLGTAIPIQGEKQCQPFQVRIIKGKNPLSNSSGQLPN
jgi:hypothetical protein